MGFAIRVYLVVVHQGDTLRGPPVNHRSTKQVSLRSTCSLRSQAMGSLSGDKPRQI